MDGFAGDSDDSNAGPLEDTKAGALQAPAPGSINTIKVDSKSIGQAVQQANVVHDEAKVELKKAVETHMDAKQLAREQQSAADEAAAAASKSHAALDKAKADKAMVDKAATTVFKATAEK